MTTDERDVLRRCRERIGEYDSGPGVVTEKLLADIDRVLAADEDAKYKAEAEDLCRATSHPEAASPILVMLAAKWLKDRDARRKEEAK